MKKNYLRRQLHTVLLSAVMISAMAIPAFADNAGQVTGTRKFGNAPGSEASGQIEVTYDTAGGKTVIDKDEDGNEVTVDNGTFVVTIPSTISITGMNIGKVDMKIPYEVNVKGSIPSDQTVTLTADSVSLQNGSDSISETTKQGKTVWTAAEVYGGLNEKGAVTGTTSNDSVTLSGTARSAGSYTGNVTYTAAIR